MISKTRKSNIELLRIIMMFLIVLSHLNCYTNFNNIDDINSLLVSVFGLGSLAVDVFFIIFGYFNINKDFSFKKIIKLEFQAVFYAVIIYVICSIFGYASFDIKSLLYCFIPTLTGQWWFLTAYIVIYVLSPLIKLIMSKMNTKLVLIIDIIVMLLCFALIVLNVDSTIITMADCFGMYILGACIRKLNIKIPIKYSLVIIFVTVMMFIITSIVLCNNNYSLSCVMNKLEYRTSPFMIIMAIMLFVLFNSLDFHNEFVNKIAKNTFAVYLISDSRLLRDLIWNKVFKLYVYENSVLLPLYSVIVCLIIMIVCIGVEEVRRRAFNRIRFINN